jgi:ABC-type uncharacterized transport system substrate-binding protein
MTRTVNTSAHQLVKHIKHINTSTHQTHQLIKHIKHINTSTYTSTHPHAHVDNSVSVDVGVVLIYDMLMCWSLDVLIIVLV